MSDQEPGSDATPRDEHDSGRDEAHDQASPERRDGWRRVPSPARLAPRSAMYEEILARHDASLASGIPTYADPASGFSVFTADFLAQRNYCCDSGCRHCPYVC